MGIRKDELSHLAGIDFFKLAKSEPHPRTRIRLMALGHIQQGKPKKEIVDMFKTNIASLRHWFLRFMKHGLLGLQEGQRPGRQQRLAREREEEFRNAVEALQAQREGGRIGGHDIQKLLKEQFSADYALSGVYELLRRCGMSWISVRSKHPKSDPVCQEEFKKNFKKR